MITDNIFTYSVTVCKYRLGDSYIDATLLRYIVPVRNTDGKVQLAKSVLSYDRWDFRNPADISNRDTNCNQNS
jgi:hypothetical protein